MTTALLELLSLGLSQLGEIKNLNRRAELLDAAAEVCAQAECLDRANDLRATAAELRRADQAQLSLIELFSNYRA